MFIHRNHFVITIAQQRGKMQRKRAKSLPHRKGDVSLFLHSGCQTLRCLFCAPRVLKIPCSATKNVFPFPFRYPIMEKLMPTTIRSTVPYSAWSRLAPNTGSIKSRINVWKHSGVSPVSLPCTSSDTHVSDQLRGRADAEQQWRQARVSDHVKDGGTIISHIERHQSR